MGNVTVPVPDGREGEFFEMFGRWLQGGTDATASPTAPEAQVQSWVNSDSDLERAKRVWSKLSDRGLALFCELLDAGDEQLNGEQLAVRLGILNGKYGVAGVLAWPGRHCAAVGRPLPVDCEDGPVGGSASYSFPEPARTLFARARAILEAQDGKS